MRDYLLHTLGATRFENLIARICDEILGTGTQVFSPGRDSGVDAFFEGTARKYPSETDPWSGKFVVQAKWTASPRASCSDKEFARIINKELSKVVVLRSKGLCDNYLLFTNRKLTSAKSAEIVQNLRKKTDVAQVAIFGIEQIGHWLDGAPELVRRFGIQVDPQVGARYQLVPPPADFIGRERELAKIRQVLRAEGSILICGLQGPGGAGKTALALRISDEVYGRYPDGQLLVELRGTDPKPQSVVEAMTKIILALQPGVQLPDAAEDLAALYRSILQGRRILLLLDNAADAWQVEPLLLSRGSLTLVPRPAR